MEIHGHCDERFGQVRELFEANFTEFGDVGASFAASIEGEMVVDLWGGHADAARTRPWEEDTVVNVYSTTKTMSFLCALVLADRGELDLYAKVTDYWPEYGINGKEATEVRHFLSHAAGVPGFEPPIMDGMLMCDWQHVIDNLAAQAPWWEPGTQSGYHAITQGYLIGEVVQRVTGKTIGTFFREEIAEPLGADFFIGMDDSVFPRVADILPDDSEVSGNPFEALGAESITMRVFSSPPMDSMDANSAEWRRAEIPAAGGHGNARGVVRAQTPLANGGSAFGVDLLSAEGCERMADPQTDGVDAVLMFPVKYGMGFAYPNDVLPMSPNDTAMFWGGAGGSTIAVDRENHVCLSYVMNQMRATLVGDERGARLGKALYAAL
ncbi:MAG: serine hydrolase domain-containing protein [Pseudomonadales bacterium]|nr:serine hydrolase domain-containing protein [Pseudomonadales bacterium]